jgi:2'-5' RNA ligase
MQTHAQNQGEHQTAPQSESILYWLTPAPAEHTVCEAWVESLAAMLGGPVFVPHLTLFVSRAAPGEDVDAILERAASEIVGPVTLRSAGLGFEDSFTKCCYIQFEPDEKLARLSARLRESSSAPTDYHLNPHLSLFYGHLDEAQRESVRHMVQPPEELSFDAVCAVSSAAAVTSRDEVEAWRVISARRLDTPALIGYTSQS